MPKNIVLLSDGTGNSAAQLLKTNVWRIYESLQLNDPGKQVACYDDGVGTSSFKPLALLGGAFGVGMARNVLRLYRFLCEHYEPGDRIFAFGFSRGSFTIRVLIGLICDQGIIKTRPPIAGRGSPAAADSAAAAAAAPDADHTMYGSELARLSRWAYREFRKQFNQTGGLVTVARALRDVLLRLWERRRGHERYDKRWNHVVDSIEFVGVWDTVDAYGLPIDELTDGVDRWIWPLSMPELKLSPKVKKACHVLALDDERNTFHPVLWDEEDESQTKTDIKDERISQVWFAGMHSNVGGGYPDDALSCVSLNWMTEQAKGHDLHFWQQLLDHQVAKADPLGRIYDSRSGLKAYYRYNPRKIEWLTNGQVHEQGFFKRRWPKPFPTVTIRRPKIHQSVFDRIAAAPEAYAPIVFPERYAVVTDKGRILDGEANPFETDLGRQARFRAQEAAWNLVWRKRIVYFLTVGVSLVLALLPFMGGANTGATVERGALTRLVLWLGELLPSFAAPWVYHYAAEPRQLIIGAVLLAPTMYYGRRLEARICDTMRAIWLRLTSAPPETLEAVRMPTDLLYRFRSHPAYQGTMSVFRRKVLPTVFGLTTLLWLAGAAYRLPFEAASAAGLVCRGSGVGEGLQLKVASRPVTLASTEPCAATGLRLDAGARYRIHLEPPDSGVWRDLNVDVPFPAGFTVTTPGLTLLERAVLTLSTPFRRQWMGNWFVPIARVGNTGIEQHRLSSATTEITALTSGELFLFVNDAIIPLRVWPPALGWDVYYRNNDGSATVTVTKIAEAPSTSDP